MQMPHGPVGTMRQVCLDQFASAVAYHHIVHFRDTTVCCLVGFLSIGDEGIIQVIFHQVDGTSTETSTHDTRTGNTVLLGQVVEEVKLFAAYFVQTAHAIVGFIHAGTDGFIVAFFQGSTDIHHALYFTNHIFCPHVVFSCDFSFDFVEHIHRGIAQKFNFRMVFADGSSSCFARLTTFVVS